MRIRQKASDFALHLRERDFNVSLVTVDRRNFMCTATKEGSMIFQISGAPKLSKRMFWISEVS